MAITYNLAADKIPDIIEHDKATTSTTLTATLPN